MDKSEQPEVKKVDYIEELNNELKELSSIKELYIGNFYTDNEKILKDVNIASTTPS